MTPQQRGRTAGTVLLVVAAVLGYNLLLFLVQAAVNAGWYVQ